MPLAPGVLVGPYQVVAPLGAGGMGEVYRARDTKLNRDVAIKVLPDAFAQDAGRLARFTREAQTLAALNHTHIAHIHGLEESGGTVALVMELVEGDDLSVLIARGPLPPADALPIARQISEALEAAHDQGIVHRDLKPGNIKVRPDGMVKVLDFGLAKAMDPASGLAPGSSPDGPAGSPTMTRQFTEPGMILGTAAYMAPEQARGRAVDRRADIWAFGAVLFEMLSGVPAFAGDTVSDTLAAVLTKEPDWSVLPAATPASVRRLLQRCLERDVRRRLQAIGEARLVLEDPGASTSAETAATTIAMPAPRRRRTREMVAALAGGIALFAAGWFLNASPRTPDGTIRKMDLSIDGLDVTLGRSPTIAPDGSRVFYVSRGHLRIRPLDRLDSVDLAEVVDILYPSWSPDGRQVSYVHQGRAWRISADGGAPIEVGAVPGDLTGSGGSTWTHDGEIVFAGSDTAGLWALPITGGAGRDLLPLDRAAEADFHEIATLPDGRGLIFTVHRRGRLADMIAIYAAGKRRPVLEVPGESLRTPIYSPTGHIVYVRETTSPGLWAVPFSLDRLETTGPPFLVVPGASAPSISRDGTLCLVRSDDTPIDLVRVSRTGVIEPVAAIARTRTSMLTGGPTGTGYQQWGGVSLSPDGTRVAINVGISPGRLSVYDLARGSMSTIATGTFPSRPVWTKDGTRLIYASSRDARAWNMWSRRADAAGDEQRVATSDEVQLPGAISPDGTVLVYGEGSGPEGNLFKMSLDSGIPPSPLFPSRVWGLDSSFSPDGRFLAHESTEAGGSEIYVRPFPQGNQRIQVSTGGGAAPIWTRSGELFYANGLAISAVSVNTRGAALEVSKPVVLFQTGGNSGLAPVFDVAPDGQTLFMLRATGHEQVSLIFNWPADLSKVQSSDAPAR